MAGDHTAVRGVRMPPGAHHFAVWTYGGSITDDSKFKQGPVESIGCAGAQGCVVEDCVWVVEDCPPMEFLRCA